MKEEDGIKGLLILHAETGTEGGYWAVQDEKYINPETETWSYEGLHILRDGDQLSIYGSWDDATPEWEGEIQLHQYPLFTEDAQGFWIHADQVGVDRETWSSWFFNNYVGKLIPREKR